MRVTASLSWTIPAYRMYHFNISILTYQRDSILVIIHKFSESEISPFSRELLDEFCLSGTCNTTYIVVYWLFPAQDVHFFYRRSHLSALQKYALLFSTNFQFIFIFKNALHNLVIELCNALLFSKIIYSYILTSRTVL